MKSKNEHQDMRAFFITLSFIFCALCTFGQCEDILLKPSKDAQVWSYDPIGEIDRGTNRSDLVLYEWTKSGAPTTKYGLIQFDLSQFADATTIDSALLSLYYDPQSIDRGHAKDAGSNEFYLYRLLGEWEESVSWDKVPDYTEVNGVLVPESSSSNQDYIDLDITGLVQDMLQSPDSNHGLLMKLRYTDYYRSVVFASSEHPNNDLHPRLRIVSSERSNNADKDICNCNDFYLAPNLSSDLIKLHINKDLIQKEDINIFNSLGQHVETIKASSNLLEIELSNYADGYYYISTLCEKRKVLRFGVVRS